MPTLLTYILLSLFAGNLTDRLGARKIIPMFGVVLGIGTLLMGTSASFWQASMFFGIVGMGAAAMWTPIIALVQRWFAVKKRNGSWYSVYRFWPWVLLQWANCFPL